MNIQDAADRFARWLIATQDLSPHTVRAYCSDVAALQRHVGDDFDVTELSRDKILGFVDDMRSNGLRSTSMRRRLIGVGVFLKSMQREGVLASNPAGDLDVRFSRPRSLPRAISSHELRVLLRSLQNAAHTSMAAPLRNDSQTTLLAVALMVGTGMRSGELVALTKADLDLPSRTIRVTGKGRRERLVYLSNSWICDALARYQDLESADLSAPLLTNRYSRHLTTAALRGRLDRAGVTAGLDRRITPHMLRHTAATQLIEAGVDIRFVQRLLGHASITTTEIYTHVADVSLRRAVVEADVLGRALT